jgi:hypothetical protein
MLLQRTPAPPTEMSASEPCRSLKKPRWPSPAPSQAAKVPGGVAERVGGVVAERVGAPDIVSPPPAPTPADVAQPLSNSRRPPANPGQGSFKRRQRSCGRARRGAPIPRHPAACLRQRAPLGWPAAPATARPQFTAPSAPPAGLLRHGSAYQQGGPKAAGDQAPAFQGRRNTAGLNYKQSYRGSCGHSCRARQCPGAV